MAEQMSFVPEAAKAIRLSAMQARIGALSQWRDEMDLRLDYWDGNQEPDLRAALMADYPRTFDRMRKWTFNLTRRVCDARGAAYETAPTRVLVNLDGKPITVGKDTESFEWLVERGELDAQLDQMASLVELYKTMAVWPQFRNRAGESWIEHELIDPQKIFVVQNERELSSLPAAYGALIQLDDRTDTEGTEPIVGRYAWWSPEWYSLVEGSIHQGVFRLRRVIEGYPNPYGTIPIVLFHAGKPRGEIFLSGGKQLIPSNRIVNMLLTDFKHLMKMQSHGQPWIRAQKDQRTRLNYGPDFAIKLRNSDEEFGFASPDAKIAAVKEAIEWTLKATGSSELLSPNQFATVRTELSGIAKTLDEWPLIKHVTKMQGLFRPREQRLFNLDRIIWNHHAPDFGLKLIPIKVKLQISYPPYEFPADPHAEFATKESKIDRGVIGTLDAIKDEHGVKTDKEAEEILTKNLEQIETVNAATAPASPFGGLFGSSEKKPKAIGDGDVVEGEIVEDTTDATPATKSEGEVAAAPEETLNGAQIKELKQMAIDVAEGKLPKESARALITAAFPIDPSTIDAILAPIEEGSKKPAPLPPAFGGPPPKPASKDDEKDEDE